MARYRVLITEVVRQEYSIEVDSTGSSQAMEDAEEELHAAQPEPYDTDIIDRQFEVEQL